MLALLLVLLLACVLAGSEAPSPSTTVTWNVQLGRCVPDVCKGANATQIPELCDHEVPAHVLEALPQLYDTGRARECLKNKHIVLLGDSLMAETFHDLVLLLLGIGAPCTHAKTFYIINIA